MKNFLRKNSGITLIALVITIIVLLILAGVVIASLTGDNGLLNRAVQAKEKTERAEVIEKVRLEILGDITGNKGEDLDEDALIDILTDYFKEDSIPDDLTDMTAILTTKDEKFNDITLAELIGDVIVARGSTKLKATKDGTEVNLSAVSESKISTYYGEETSYKSISHPNITWQLFLADTSNYYLIASDYVPTNELPCKDSNVNGVTYGSTDLRARDGIGNSYYKVGFTYSANYNDYVMTSTEHIKGSQANTLKAGSVNRNPLVSTYLRWVDAYPTSNNKNISAVAYMMDTEKWSSFADGAGASYAIGGPTIEMFAKSYNEADISTHTNKLVGYNDASENNGWNSYGYQEKTEKDSSWKNDKGGSGDLDTTNATGDTEGNMWIRNKQSKATGYWLASPSSAGTARIWIVKHDGRIDHDAVFYSYGIRPVVVVPKS